jgi:polysaccharide biosynthesis/export protein VpsN
MNRLLLIIATLLTLMQQHLAAQGTELPLGRGDQIGITISGIPPEELLQIKNNYRISDRGTISLLYLGEITAAGMKPSDLERKIEGMYKSKEIYTHPTVTISVDTGTIADRVVFVSGEVNKVGPVPFRPGLTASRAISSAGGGTPFARLSKTKLVRNGQVVAELDLSRGGNADSATQMQPDDELVVPD